MESKESVVEDIRNTEGKETQYRQQIATLSAAGMLDFSVISLYQLGIINKLPDIPGDVFDSNKVNASEDAQILGLPDGPVSLAMYAVNLVLAAGAIKEKKKGNIFDYLLAASALGQAAGGAYYLYNMAAVQKKVCIYCVTGALLNFATLVPLAKLFLKR